MEGIARDQLQKANFANGYLPFEQSIPVQASAVLQEIRENLSRSVQLADVPEATSVWSQKLDDFLSLYGFSLSKGEHLQLIHFYLAIVEKLDLSYPVAASCFSTLTRLTE